MSRFNVEIVVDTGNKKEANIIKNSFKQEEELKKRTTSSVRVKKNKVIINIKSEDVVALRAAANNYLRLLQTIFQIEI